MFIFICFRGCGGCGGKCLPGDRWAASLLFIYSTQLVPFLIKYQISSDEKYSNIALSSSGCGGGCGSCGGGCGGKLRSELNKSNPKISISPRLWWLWGLERRLEDDREVYSVLCTHLLSFLPSLAAVNLNILYKQDCYELIQTLHQNCCISSD